jgi:hypothetical protein
MILLKLNACFKNIQEILVMKTQNNLTLASLIWSWVYGLICGLGIASTTVGFMRGEAMPGVIWPALIPLLIAPILILRVMGANKN